MLLKILYDFRKQLHEKRLLFQKIIFVLSILSLMIKPKLTTVSSVGLLSKNLDYPFELSVIKFKDEFNAITSPANTILILCDPKDEALLDLLYGSVKNLNINFRKIVVTTTTQKLHSKYFAIIYLSFGLDNCTLIYPLNNIQPNSDLLSISNHYFPIRLKYSFADAFYNLNYNMGFTLHLQTQYSRKHIKQLCIFLRALINVGTFTSGKYFYIPLKNTHIDIMQLLPFCILTFTFHLVTWIEKHNNGNAFSTVMNLLVFYFAPITFPICFFLKEKEFSCR